jgi:pimeloyl-ACP methyl ester carboxylesterase
MDVLHVPSQAVPEPVVFQTNDGLRLRADAWGDSSSTPVLLLHGGAQTRHSWKRTAKTMGALGYRAIAIDLRGHGESDWAKNSPYTLDRYVSDIATIVEKFPKKPVLIGASLGGMISLLYGAGIGKNAISAVVLVDIATRHEDAGVSRIKTFLTAHREGFDSLEKAGEAVAVYLKHRRRPTVLHGLARNLRKGEDGRYYWHWDPAFISSPLMQEVHDEQRLLTAAKAIDVPLLLVRGAESDIVSPEIMAHFLAEVPQAEYVEVGGAGHTLAGDSNDDFTDAVIAFLKKQDL